MQIKIMLKGNRIKLPIATSRTVQGFIYNALHTDEEYQENLHETGKMFEDRKYKLFTFGELRGNYEVERKIIVYKRSVSLEIRCVDSYMMQILYNHFSCGKKLLLGKNCVEVESVSTEERKISSDNIKIKTLSPITVYLTDEEGHTHYYSPQEELFYDLIVNNARRKWNSFSKDNEDFDFSIIPAENKNYIKRVTRFKGTLITAWHGEFYLKGNPKFLEFLYNTGIGSKSSQGFGMFELI